MRTWFLLMMLVAASATGLRADPAPDLRADELLLFRASAPTTPLASEPYPTFAAGETWVVSLRGRNAGSAPTEAGTARLVIAPAEGEGPAVVTLDLPIPALEPGQEFALDFQDAVSFPSGAALGRYTVQVSLDPAQALAEADEANNSLPPRTVELGPSAPLGFDLGLVHAKAADSGEVVVMVRNGGPGDSPEGAVELTSSDGQRLSQPVPPLMSGGNTEVKFQVTPPAQGFLTLTLAVRARKDTNAGNNSTALTLWAGGKVPGR